MPDKAVRVWVYRDKPDGGEYGICRDNPRLIKSTFYSVDCLAAGMCPLEFHKMLGVRLRKGQKRQFDWLRTGTTIELREVKST